MIEKRRFGRTGRFGALVIAGSRRRAVAQLPDGAQP